jgi:hypothetical protein
MTNNVMAEIALICDINHEMRVEKNFARQNIWKASVAKSLPKSLDELLESIAPSLEIQVKGSPGNGSDAHYPFLRFTSGNSAQSGNSGIYVALTFRGDGKCGYLSITHGIGLGKSVSQISQSSSKFRANLVQGNDSGIPTKYSPAMDLGNIDGVKSSRAKQYEAAVVIAIEVSSDWSDSELASEIVEIFSQLEKISSEAPGPTVDDLSEFALCFVSSDSKYAELISRINQGELEIPGLNSTLTTNIGAWCLLRPKTLHSDSNVWLGRLSEFNENTLLYKLEGLQEVQIPDSKSNFVDDATKPKKPNAAGPFPIPIDIVQTLMGVKIMTPLENPLLGKLIGFKNVILEGVAGTGKTHSIIGLKESGFFEKVSTTVFHPSYGYEEFVEGLKPDGNNFVIYDGIFMDCCLEASANPEKNYLLVIDEINRADTSKVLGDLLNAIEPSKRVSAATAQMIMSDEMNSPFGDGVLLGLLRTGANGVFRRRLAVPENLYILGTMNTTDRSVGTLDLALRRRFTIQRVNPMPPEILITSLSDSSVKSEIETWAMLNELLELKIGRDAQIGHSYFFEIEAANIRVSKHSYSTKPHLWGDLILPQVCEILVTFGATRLVDQGVFDGLDFGGFELKVQGQGLDSHPVVAKK